MAQDRKTFYLVIKTPDKTFYSEPVRELVVKTPEGEIGILPGHEAMVVAVAIGPIRILTKDDEWIDAVVSEGFMDINPDMTALLSDTAEWPEEIDVNRARRAEERAKERMQSKLSRIEYIQSQAALQRALSRLEMSTHSPHMAHRH